jgi:hypothetical protein
MSVGFLVQSVHATKPPGTPDYLAKPSVTREHFAHARGSGETGHVHDEADATDTSALTEQTMDSGAIAPSSEVRAELQAHLDADPSRVGEVYWLLGEGIHAEAISERLEGGAACAWQYRRMVRALLDGSLPTAPTVALAAARRYRTVLKAHGLSDAARAYLEAC